jgi:hypothetical protein
MRRRPTDQRPAGYARGHSPPDCGLLRLALRGARVPYDSRLNRGGEAIAGPGLASGAVIPPEAGPTPRRPAKHKPSRPPCTKVQATLLQAALPWGIGGSEATARWKAPDGPVRTGEVFVLSGAPPGNTVMVWTNQAGLLTDPPLHQSQVTAGLTWPEGSPSPGLRSR